MNKYENLNFEYLKEKVTSIRQYLKRKGSSGKTEGNIDKSVLGALHSSGLFNKLDKNIWEIK